MTSLDKSNRNALEILSTFDLHQIVIWTDIRNAWSILVDLGLGTWLSDSKDSFQTIKHRHRNRYRDRDNRSWHITTYMPRPLMEPSYVTSTHIPGCLETTDWHVRELEFVLTIHDSFLRETGQETRSNVRTQFESLHISMSFTASP